MGTEPHQYHPQSASFLGPDQFLTGPSSPYFPEFANSSRSQSPWKASALPSAKESGDLSDTRSLSYFPTLNDYLDIQSPSGPSVIVDHDYYSPVPSLETSELQLIPEISHCPSFEPTNQANHSDRSSDCPSASVCSGPEYSLSAGTSSSLQDPASSQNTRHTDVEDSGESSSQEFSVGSNHGQKDSPSNAALLCDVNSTDFTDSPIAQYSEASASQLRNNNSNRARFARAEKLDLACKETIISHLPVRKQDTLSCPDCSKKYLHRHELK